jgi:hypothetical protein
MKHTCHAIGCEVSVPPKMLMCKRHWSMVSKRLQATIWASYKPGQEITKDPSMKYLAAQQFVVGEVAKLEGKLEESTECFRNALRFSELARKEESN